MNAWQVVILTLAALLVGLLIPVLLQARSSLREFERRLSTSAEYLLPILHDAQLVARRVNILSQGLEGREKQLGEIINAVGQLAGTVQRVQGAARTASMAGAAVAALVHAYRQASAEADSAEAHGGATSAETEAAAAAAPDEPRAEAAVVPPPGAEGERARTETSPGIEEEAA